MLDLAADHQQTVRHGDHLPGRRRCASTPKSISERVITSGGATRRVAWNSLHSTPRSASASDTASAGRAALGDLHAGPQAPAADLGHAVELAEPGVQVGAEFAGALLELAGGQQAHHRAADGARHRVAAERRAVFARLEHAEHVGPADHRRHREDPAAERLADGVHVRADALVVERQRRAGAGQARLDLVGDEQRVGVVAELADLGEVALRRDDHPGLTLDGLQQDGRGVAGDRRAEGLGVAVRDDREARRERAELVAGLRVGGEGDDRRGAAVEVVARHHDLGGALGHALDLVGPLPGDLHGRLDRLGPGVGGQHHLGAGQLGQLAGRTARTGRGGRRGRSASAGRAAPWPPRRGRGAGGRSSARSSRRGSRGSAAR